MNAVPAQTFSNHARFVPLYHYVALGILAVNVLWSAWRLVTGFGVQTVLGVLVACALLLVALYARVFALAAQDRVIRLEMRWRLAELLPTDLNRRFDELSKDQLVSLRFAGDAELPDLMLAVLEEDEQDRTTIKKRIKDWQADHWRV